MGKKKVLKTNLIHFALIKLVEPKAFHFKESFLTKFFKLFGILWNVHSC